MNVDPVDFTTVDELRRIAGGLLKHTPDAGQPAFGFKLNCVQWSTMVFSLAVCFPLSREMLAVNGMLADYERNWSSSLGFADEGLVGLNELPIPFYSVKEAVAIPEGEVLEADDGFPVTIWGESGAATRKASALPWFVCRHVAYPANKS